MHIPEKSFKISIFNTLLLKHDNYINYAGIIIKML